MFFKKVILFALSMSLISQGAWAASCCGGGGSSSLVLPKFALSMYEFSASSENYDGFWNADGNHVADPPESDLNQYRASLGFAYRIGDRWQASVSVPYVWNNNEYSGVESRTNGVGDTSVGLWYENFDDIKCIWRVTDWKSLMPAIYFGSTLTVPTGRSAYSGNVNNSFDVTGRGVYRLDGSMLLDKTIYPWNMTVQFSYGTYLERPVNQEFGKAIEPYDKKLGDRISTGLSLGYTHFLDNLSTLTFTGSLNDLREGDGEINGKTDASISGFKKQSIGFAAAYSSASLDWIYKLSFNHSLQGNGRGENFPTTNIISLGLSYVIR